jgi:hypothetical protein
MSATNLSGGGRGFTGACRKCGVVDQTAAAESVQKLRARIAETRSAQVVSYSKFRKLREAVVAAARDIFGPQSSEEKDANVPALLPSQLKKLEQNAAALPIVYSRGNVTRIMRVPKGSGSDYYRKRLDDLDEVITSMLLSLGQH